MMLSFLFFVLLSLAINQLVLAANAESSFSQGDTYDIIRRHAEPVRTRQFWLDTGTQSEHIDLLYAPCDKQDLDSRVFVHGHPFVLQELLQSKNPSKKASQPSRSTAVQSKTTSNHKVEDISSDEQDSDDPWRGSFRDWKRPMDTPFTDEIINVGEDTVSKHPSRTEPSVSGLKDIPTFPPWGGLALEPVNSTPNFPPWGGLALETVKSTPSFLPWGGLELEMATETPNFAPWTGHSRLNDAGQPLLGLASPSIQNGRSHSNQNKSTHEPATPTEHDFLPKRSKKPKKDKQQLALQREIQDHVTLLAQVPLNEGEMHYLVARQAEVRRYETTLKPVHGPSVENFAYDDSAVVTAWYKRLAHVFAHSFRSAQQASGSPFATLDMKEDPNSDYKSSASCATRRNTTIKSRHYGAKSWKHFDNNLETVCDVLERVPPECHSEDEKDDSGGQVTYQIRKLPWRNPALGSLFNVLDRLAVAKRIMPDGKTTKGNWPRLRQPSNRLGNPRVPHRLPRNFYDPDYLESISDDDFEELDVQPPVPIRLAAKTLRLAARYDGPLKNKNVKPLARNDISLPTYRSDVIDLL
ncbi:hypothetical protein BJ165DRAFT_1410383 [Panaeolus papilionaceus]|nr:hypothetical protein BJ165DRAFT_1410383 [Panaeolus papilionaceus]